ncbi:MAG: hypothetical protein HUU50_14515 [Candidatus Brocadiae bacterium]|nr:hypothetical protein [Candidatus Brocadiia bacterium]
MKMLLLVCFLAYCMNAVLFGQPLIGGKVHDIPLKDENMTVRFVPDIDDDEQYYYFPVRLALATQNFGNLKNVPMLQFIKYNFDVRNERLLQGGIIQFGVTMALPPAVLEKAKKALAKEVKKASIKAGMIPISSAQVTVLAAEVAGITGKVLGSGEAVRHPGAVMPFVIPVTPEGASVYEKMLQGTAGIGLQMTYSYKGMTPKIHCKVTGTWDKAYNHYSKSQSAQTTVKYLWFGGSAKADWSSFKEKLLEDTDIKIEWNPKPDENTEEGKKLVKLVEESIITKITEAVFKVEAPKPDEPVQKASAGTETGEFFGLNYAINLKEVDKKRQGKIQFSYLGRSWMEFKNEPVGSFVSLANEPDAVKKIMFTEVSKDEFFNGLKVICFASIDPTPYNIRELKYCFEHGNTKQTQSFQADAKGYLVSIQEKRGEQTNPIFFATGKDTEKKVKYHIEVTTQIGKKMSTLESKQYDLGLNGYEEISFTPEKTGIESVSIDFKHLMFYNEAQKLLNKQKKTDDDDDDDDNDEDDDDEDQAKKKKGQKKESTEEINPKDFPKYVKVELKHGQRTFSIKLDSKVKKANEGEIIWFINKNEEPVRCHIVAKYAKGSKYYRRNEESNLAKAPEGLQIVLDIEDFIEKK